eukprot:COSAG01_NODE_2134_length_8347_cov_43.066319_2_plen_169_part_00
MPLIWRPSRNYYWVGVAGLSGLGMASLVIALGSALLFWAMVGAMPPDAAAGRIQLLPPLPCQATAGPSGHRPVHQSEDDGTAQADATDEAAEAESDVEQQRADGATTAEQAPPSAVAAAQPPPPLQEQEQQQTDAEATFCPRCEYLSSAFDQMVRSTALSASLWLMTL